MIALPLRFQIKNLATLGRRRSIRPAEEENFVKIIDDEFWHRFLPPIRYYILLI